MKCLKDRKNMNVISSESGRCAHCQEGEKEDHSLLPVPVETAEGTKDAWLHPGCIEGWNKERMKHADRELSGLGIELPCCIGWDIKRSAALLHLVRAATNEIVRCNDYAVNELNKFVQEIQRTSKEASKKGRDNNVIDLSKIKT